MEVRYTLAMDDYVAFNLYVYRKSGIDWGSYLFAWAVGPLTCAGGVVMLLQLGPGYDALAISLFVTGLVWTFAYPVMHRSAALRRRIQAFGRKTGVERMLGERTLIFSEESLVEINEVGRSEVKWRDMDRVEEVGDTTYIFITRLSGWILPRHGFEREEDYYAARDFAFRKLADRAEGPTH